MINTLRCRPWRHVVTPLALLLPLPADAGVTLVKDRTVQVGVDARATHLEDIDGDSYPELLSLSETQGVLNLLVNESAATDNETFEFGARDVYAVGEQPTEIGIGDMDGDGRADIVAASREDNVVVVFLVREPGVLVESARLEAGDGPYDVHVRDLDGDGDNDLLVGERVGDSVSVYLSAGDGYGFSARRSFATVNEARQVALGDFDADGDADLAVAGQQLQIYLNDGSANFLRSQTLDLNELLQCATATDLDEDGADDLVVSGLEETRLYVLRANSGGRFSADDDDPEHFEVIDVSFLPNVLIGTDIDDDGHGDVVLASRSEAEIFVYTGSGYGGLAATQLVTEVGAIASVAVGDIDRDGRKDLVATPRDFNDAILYRGMGSVPYDGMDDVVLGGALGKLVPDTVTQDAVRVLAADIRRKLVHVLQVSADGAALTGAIPTVAVPSILHARPLGDDSEVFYSASSGTIIERARLDAQHESAVLPDIVIDDGFVLWMPGSFSSAGARELLVIETDGDAVLRSIDDTGDTDITSHALAGIPRSGATADLDGDGIDEAVLVNESVVVLSATGGTVSVEEYLELPAAPDRVRLQDADDDGDADLVLVYGERRRVDIHLNDSGTFAAVPLSVATTRPPVDAAMPDINGDGRVGLAVSAGERIALYERTGNDSADGEYRIVNHLTMEQPPADLLALPLSGAPAMPLLASFGTDDHLVLFTRTDNRRPVAEDLAFTVNTGDVLEGMLTASDEDGDSLEFTLTLPPDSGEFTLLDPVTGRFKYTPSTAPGDAYVHYAVSDDGEASQPAVVKITVESPGGGGAAGMALLFLLPAVLARCRERR